MMNRVEVLSKEKTQNFLDQSFSRETSLYNNDWTPDEPHYGQCAAASLVAQDFRGGYIREYILPRGLISWTLFCTHYVNVVEEKVEDYTRHQFPEGFPYDELIEGRIGWHTKTEDIRERILAFEDLAICYQLLKGRFIKNLYETK